MSDNSPSKEATETKSSNEINIDVNGAFLLSHADQIEKTSEEQELLADEIVNYTHVQTDSKMSNVSTVTVGIMLASDNKNPNDTSVLSSNENIEETTHTLANFSSKTNDSITIDDSLLDDQMVTLPRILSPKTTSFAPCHEQKLTKTSEEKTHLENNNVLAKMQRFENHECDQVKSDSECQMISRSKLDKNKQGSSVSSVSSFKSASCDIKLLESTGNSKFINDDTIALPFINVDIHLTEKQSNNNEIEREANEKPEIDTCSNHANEKSDERTVTLDLLDSFRRHSDSIESISLNTFDKDHMYTLDNHEHEEVLHTNQYEMMCNQTNNDDEDSIHLNTCHKQTTPVNDAQTSSPQDTVISKKSSIQITNRKDMTSSDKPHSNVNDSSLNSRFFKQTVCIVVEQTTLRTHKYIINQLCERNESNHKVITEKLVDKSKKVRLIAKTKNERILKTKCLDKDDLISKWHSPESLSSSDALISDNDESSSTASSLENLSYDFDDFDKNHHHLKSKTTKYGSKAQRKTKGKVFKNSNQKTASFKRSSQNNSHKNDVSTNSLEKLNDGKQLRVVLQDFTLKKPLHSSQLNNKFEKIHISKEIRKENMPKSSRVSTGRCKKSKNRVESGESNEDAESNSNSIDGDEDNDIADDERDGDEKSNKQHAKPRKTRNSSKALTNQEVCNEIKPRRKRSSNSNGSGSTSQQYKDQPPIKFSNLKIKLTTREAKKDQAELKTKLIGLEQTDEGSDRPNEQKIKKSEVPNNIQLSNAFNMSNEDDTLGFEQLKHASSSSIPLYQTEAYTDDADNMAGSARSSLLRSRLSQSQDEAKTCSMSLPKSRTTSMSSDKALVTETNDNEFASMIGLEEANIITLPAEIVESQITIPYNQEPVIVESNEKDQANGTMLTNSVHDKNVDNVEREYIRNILIEQQYDTKETKRTQLEEANDSNSSAPQNKKAKLSGISKSPEDKSTEAIVVSSSSSQSSLNSSTKLPNLNLGNEPKKVKRRVRRKVIQISKDRLLKSNDVPNTPNNTHANKLKNAHKLTDCVVRLTRMSDEEVNKIIRRKQRKNRKRNGTIDTSLSQHSIASPSFSSSPLSDKSKFYVGENLFARGVNGNFHPARIQAINYSKSTEANNYDGRVFSCQFYDSISEQFDENNVVSDLRAKDLIRLDSLKNGDNVITINTAYSKDNTKKLRSGVVVNTLLDSGNSTAAYFINLHGPSNILFTFENIIVPLKTVEKIQNESLKANKNIKRSELSNSKSNQSNSETPSYQAKKPVASRLFPISPTTPLQQQQTKLADFFTNVPSSSNVLTWNRHISKSQTNEVTRDEIEFDHVSSELK